MKEYQKGEFCQAVNCKIRADWEKKSSDPSEFLKNCRKKCIKSAHEFHDWLIKEGFSIQKR